MTAGRFRVGATVAAALCLLAMLPADLPALQLAGTVNIGTGPVSRDQTDAREPLLQGALGASYRMPLLFGLRPDLAGELGFSSEPARRTAMRWDLGARLHTTGRTTGAWLGVALGGADVGRTTSELTRLEGGVRRAFGPAGIDVWMSRTAFGAGIAPSGRLGVDANPLDTLGRSRVTEYTELGSRATLGLGRYDLGFTVTRRFGTSVIRRTGWEVSGTWWVASSVGVLGAIGRSLPQFGLAVPGGRYGTVGLRLSLGTGGKRESGKAEKRVGAERAPLLGIAGRRLTIEWAPAREAEVMGDFTDWKPVALVPAGGGRWVFPVELEPGLHHLNVRFDGGAWLVPDGAVAVDDGFGGRVGMVVVR